MQLQKAHYFLYIFGDKAHTEVKIGIADNIHQQLQLVAAHENATRSSGDYKLVYFEHYDIEEVARHRESQIKGNSKDMTYHLIESMNPNWLDLSDLIQE